MEAAELEPLERLIILLRYGDELEWPEVAAVLERPEDEIRRIDDAIQRRMAYPRQRPPK